jgi:hypothetical protein
MGRKFRLPGIVSNKCARWWGGGAIPVHGGLPTELEIPGLECLKEVGGGGGGGDTGSTL